MSARVAQSVEGFRNDGVLAMPLELDQEIILPHRHFLWAALDVD